MPQKPKINEKNKREPLVSENYQDTVMQIGSDVFDHSIPPNSQIKKNKIISEHTMANSNAWTEEYSYKSSYAPNESFNLPTPHFHPSVSRLFN